MNLVATIILYFAVLIGMIIVTCFVVLGMCLVVSAFIHKDKIK